MFASLKLCVAVSDGRRAGSPPAAHQNDQTEFTKLKFKNLRTPKKHSVLTRQAIIPRSHQISWDKSSQAAADTELALASLNPESLQSFSFRLFAFVSFLSSPFTRPPFSAHVCESVNYLPVQYPDLINGVCFFPALPFASFLCCCIQSQDEANSRSVLSLGSRRGRPNKPLLQLLAGPSSPSHIRSVCVAQVRWRNTFLFICLFKTTPETLRVLDKFAKMMQNDAILIYSD